MISAGVRPSWHRKPWEACAKRFRGIPVSTTSTRRRARPSCIAAESPAKLPPTTMTSYISAPLRRASAVEHPADAEPVDEQSEIAAPEHGLQWHVDRAAGGE